MRSATIYDVARAAGVSHQTVSRVLRGFEGIRPATRDKVVKALADLEYRPNAAARQLRLRRINRIGVLVHAVGETGPSRTLAGAADEAARQGYVLDIVPMDGDDPGSIETAVALAAEHQIAGLIVTAQTTSVLDSLSALPLQVPIVTEVGLRPEAGGLNHDEAIGAMAAQHLLDLGHRSLAYVAGPASWAVAESRERGFRMTVGGADARVEASTAGDWSAGSGYAAVARLLDAPGPVTAIAAANDGMAIGVLAALVDRGVSVPGDMSVMGTDNIPESEFQRPALSTIALDFEAEGRSLVTELLVAVGEIDAASPLPEVRAPLLIARSSTAHIDRRASRR